MHATPIAAAPWLIHQLMKQSSVTLSVIALAAGFFGEAVLLGRAVHAAAPRAEESATFCRSRLPLELVSHASCPSGELGNDYSAFPALSEDGRFVTFFSAANNLVRGDSGASEDVFIFDRVKRNVRRLSDGLGASREPNINKTGRFVTFYSTSSDLVDGDTNGKGDVFVRDLLTNEIERVSVGEGGIQGDDDATGISFDPAQRPGISRDGRFVVFVSQAKNLVAGDTNGKADIFVRDRSNKTTRRMSVSSKGVQADAHCGSAHISDDGSVIAFVSSATNLVDGQTERNAHADVYVHTLGKTTRVSQSRAGTAGNASSQRPVVSGDGASIAFASAASNLTPNDDNQLSDIFVYDLKYQQLELVSRRADGTLSNGFSNGPAISADGQRIVFDSTATNLVPGSNGKISTYMVERSTQRLKLVSAGDAPANASTNYRPQLSGNGKFVAFDTSASNLVRGDTNHAGDVFVHALD